MSTPSELEELLGTSPDAVRDRERHGFDRAADPFPNDLVLFGAGGLGRRTLAGLRRAGIEPLAFADSSPTLQGRLVDGCPVLPPAEALERYNDRASFVTTIWGAVPRQAIAGRRQRDTGGQLRRMGCHRVINFTSLYCKFPDVFLPYYGLDLPHLLLAESHAIRDAFSLMADDSSRREFVAQVRWRLSNDFDALPPAVEDEQYFCDSLFRPDRDEVFVDCGEFDGDTLKVFLELRASGFGHYFAFEPDPVNYEKLRTFVSTLPREVASRVSLFPFATGGRRTRVRIDPSGLASSRVGMGTVEVDCVPLDEVITGRAPTMIKMDIEGAEPDCLDGSRGLIREHSPVLAVCVYHAQDHLWSLPRMIRDINPDYRLYLRPHKDEVFDLVCYAVPPGREP